MKKCQAFRYGYGGEYDCNFRIIVVKRNAFLFIIENVSRVVWFGVSDLGGCDLEAMGIEKNYRLSLFA